MYKFNICNYVSNNKFNVNKHKTDSYSEFDTNTESVIKSKKHFYIINSLFSHKQIHIILKHIDD